MNQKEQYIGMKILQNYLIKIQKLFLNTIYILINDIKYNPFYLHIVKKNNDMKFRVIKIISNFINRYIIQNKFKKILNFL